MSMMERFSTARVTPAERLDFWNRICTETLMQTCIDTDSDRFRARMHRWAFGEVTMVRPSAGASSLRRAPFSVPSGAESVVLHFQHFGVSRFSQDRRVAELDTGDFVLSNAEEGYAFDFPVDHEFLVLQVPRARLAARLDGLDDRLCRAMSGRTPSGRILRDFLLSLWRNGDQHLVDPDWADGIGGILCDLVTRAVTEATPGARAPDPGDPAGPDRRLRDLVEARLCEPDLRTADLAAALGVSDRAVQYAFARMSTTPSAYIQDRRLARGADLLRADPGRPVTEIAFELGFNDSSYFSRCFRQRYGVPPSHWRRARQG